MPMHPFLRILALPLAVAVATAQDPQPEPAATATAIADTATVESVPTRVEPMIRDITRIHGALPHMLVGVGVVTGLSGTGSSDRATRQAILNLIRDQGNNDSIADVTTGATALVSLTATVPAGSTPGTPIRVGVQTLGDASSLRGGTLMRAVLRGVDGLEYVVVQGKVIPGGLAVQSGTASVQKNSATTGDVYDGIVIREVEARLYSEAGDLELEVVRPTPFNIASILSGCRRALAGKEARVWADGASLVRITLPPDARTTDNAYDTLNLVGLQRVAIENPHKVSIDPVTGTVLVGEGVLISPCVVGLSDITIAVVDEDEIVQPGPLSGGETARVGRSRIDVQTNSTDFKPVNGGATVAALVQNLKSLGLTPAQMVSVFQALDTGGYLHAKLEVQ